uniref:Uncharacterized protein n=1 Tax=Anguilla anguilla TaxID=7936 RepID=A0A0E9SCD9_ANGAN
MENLHSKLDLVSDEAQSGSQKLAPNSAIQIRLS